MRLEAAAASFLSINIMRVSLILISICRILLLETVTFSQIIYWIAAGEYLKIWESFSHWLIRISNQLHYITSQFELLVWINLTILTFPTVEWETSHHVFE
jgi:hypothetical protein